MNKELFVSVIIPVYNGSQYLERCLSSINLCENKSYEIIIVDDGSTDNSAEIAIEYGAKVFRLGEKKGPARARNFGAEKALGDIIFFIDCDIAVNSDTINRIKENFNQNADIVALFGSYDDNPEEQDYYSQYMNLRHHFVHQDSSSEAVTFWSGCGAIRKDIFFHAGGFDKKKYARPCIEDIELGFRLKKMGHRILLDKGLQVKHLKKWKFRSIVRTDIFDRAVPWSMLILESREMVSDLNLKTSQKISTAFVGIIVASLFLSLLFPETLLFSLLLILLIILINYKLYLFFLKKRGFLFSLFSFMMHFLYYFYSGATYIICLFVHKLHSRKKFLNVFGTQKD